MKIKRKHYGINLPPKYSIFGVKVSSTTYEESSNIIISAAKKSIPITVTHLPVHGLVLASKDPELKVKINSFDIVAPDGQPVRWALKKLYKKELPDRVYGPELMMRLCKKAAQVGVSIYLYGSHKQVVGRLKDTLLINFPTLQIVGFESPPFRPLNHEEDLETIARINSSGAGLIFLSLGCPKQDIFAYEHRNSIKGIQICVGAAFDFLSGNKKMAPSWMQKMSLDWLFRLIQEPHSSSV